MDFDALMAEADAYFADLSPVEVEVSLGQRQARVQFHPLSGPEWRSLTLRNPPKMEILYDMRLGYDLDGVVASYPLEKLSVFVGDEVVDLSPVQGSPAGRFPEFLRRVRGGGRRDLALTVHMLNEQDPRSEIERAGKASAGAQPKKRISPANSE